MVEPGGFFAETGTGTDVKVISAPQIGNGLISFTYGLKPGIGYSQGTGVAARITTGPISSEPCIIDVLPETKLIDYRSENVLKATNKGIIYAEGYAPVPSLSPSASPVPSLTGIGPLQLSLSPVTSSVSAGTTTNLNVDVNTGVLGIGMIQAVLNYSNTCITPIVTKGTFFRHFIGLDANGQQTFTPTYTITAPQVGNGVIAFTYGKDPSLVGGWQGTGVLATITTGPTTRPCYISFTGVWAPAIGHEYLGNQLGGVSNAVINIVGQPGATPIPAPSPYVSPSPIPSPSLSPSPSPITISRICENKAWLRTMIKYQPATACKYCNVCR